MKPHTDVLIVGAGPTGLVLALWLHRQGVNVHIFDQADAPAKNSRAIVVHARTIELYRQLGLSEELVALGYKLPGTNLWVHGQHKAHISLLDFGRELTPYPFMLNVPQDDHEKMLETHLNDIGIHVQRGTKLQGFVDHGSSITATLFHETDGISTTHEASYIVGCDGAHSEVRHTIGAKYEGETYKPLFYIADVEAQDNKLSNGEGNLLFTNDTFNLMIPYSKEGHARLIGIITPNNDQSPTLESPDHDHQVTFEDVRPQITETTHIDIKNVNWFSTYRSHHRVADKFRKNRAFLVGDAAHIHSPVGGQGMNTGIMDSINLAWKLTTVLKRTDMSEEAKDQLLDSYESERRSFALTIVKSTDAGFTTLTSQGILGHILRKWLIPYLVPLVVRFEFARKRIFRGASQLICNYRGSALCQTDEGMVQSGDRLPWVRIDQQDNFSTLQDLCWQLHVYGEPGPQLDQWARKKDVKLFIFHWNDQYAEAGLIKDAVYLLRPDHYIAGIFEGSSIESRLDEYFLTRGLY
jgi:2-polyprenyl-6-methoxyphenol hydroxylase-like FAD-dependent oxidoreductase